MSGVSGRSSSSGHSTHSTHSTGHASKSNHVSASHSAKSHHAPASAASKSASHKNAASAKHHGLPGHKDVFESAKKAPSAHKSHPAKGTGKPASAHAPTHMSKDEVSNAIKQAQKVLAAHGIPASKMNAKDIAAIIQHESSGDPNAINRWDSNAKKGTPSIGLMQTISPTFNAYKLSGHDNIRDPVDNIIAGVRYSIDRYGSVSKVPGIKAMRAGQAYRGY